MSEENYDVTPLCVLFVVKGTKGDRLLFKFPFDDDDDAVGKSRSTSSKAKFSKSPYAVGIEEDFFLSRNAQSSNSLVRNGDLIGLSDDIISFLFAVRQEVCSQPLEVKVNDVRFVCYPMVLHPSPVQASSQTSSSSLQKASNDDDKPNILLFNIVFGLQGNARRSVVLCFQDLSKRLAIALKHEEGRCQYLTKQAKVMIDCLEEMQSASEGEHHPPLYKMHLHKSELAQELKQVFLDVRERGFVQLFINRWIKVSFCLPQKIHCFPGIGSLEPEKIRKFIDLMRPYHGMLLLQDVQDLLDEIPADASPDLARLVKVTSPLKSFQILSSDTDLPITLVFRLIGHLVYWGKATIIYPLCETNVYCISPSASFSSQALLTEFSESFPNYASMLAILSEFSTPISLGEFTSPLNWDPQQQAERVQMVVWFLKRFMLFQLRTYVYLCINEGDSKLNALENLKPTKISNDEEQFRSAIEKNVKNKTDVDAILRHSASENRDDLRIFIKLLRYFNGDYHLEDIMYRENLRRHELLRILTKFNDVLVVCTHEDELSSVFIEKFE